MLLKMKYPPLPPGSWEGFSTAAGFRASKAAGEGAAARGVLLSVLGGSRWSQLLRGVSGPKWPLLGPILRFGKQVTSRSSAMPGGLGFLGQRWAVRQQPLRLPARLGPGEDSQRARGSLWPREEGAGVESGHPCLGCGSNCKAEGSGVCRAPPKAPDSRNRSPAPGGCAGLAPAPAMPKSSFSRQTPGCPGRCGAAGGRAGASTCPPSHRLLGRAGEPSQPVSLP